MNKFVIIVSVDHEPKQTHISKVKGIDYSGEKPETKIFPRQQIADMIKDGYSVYTFKDDGKGNPSSSQVIAYEHDGAWFLKTKSNQQSADNLGELPPISG